MKANENNLLYRDICARFIEMNYGKVCKSENSPYLSVNMVGKHGNVLSEVIFFRDDNEDPVGENTVNSFDLFVLITKVPKNRKADIYQLISTLNQK